MSVQLERTTNIEAGSVCCDVLWHLTMNGLVIGITPLTMKLCSIGAVLLQLDC